jgi:hypothetical protein
MKHLYAITLILFLNIGVAYAQNCQVTLPASTIVLQNDTTIVSTNTGSTLNQAYLPCKLLKLDSTSTVQNLIVLRPGSSFISDSLSTVFGGYFIYADSGATVDMNHRSAISLYYKSGAILLDTNNTNATLCPNIVMDFSQMTASPICSFALAIKEKNVLSNISVYDKKNEWTIALPNVQGQTYWSLFSVDGKVVNTGFSNGKEINIDKSDLITNLYILQIQNGQSGKRIKLLNF